MPSKVPKQTGIQVPIRDQKTGEAALYDLRDLPAPLLRQVLMRWANPAGRPRIECGALINVCSILLGHGMIVDGAGPPDVVPEQFPRESTLIIPG